MLLGGGSTGGGSINLGIRLFLQDQFSGPVGQVSNTIKGLKSEFAAFQENLRASRNASLAVAAAGTAALMGMGNAVKSGAEFHYMMRGVEAVSEGTSEQMARLNALAIKLGRETMFFPKDIASGMRFMAMAGQDAETIYKTIGASVNLAGATMTELGGKMGAADIITNALKAFGWEADHSARMSDVLTKATTSANVSLVDLGNSIRYVAATSRNLAIPVEDTIAGLMSLGNAGIQATMGGTALENMYRYLANSMSSAATAKSLAAWKELGINVKSLVDSKGDFLPMVDILKKMREGMEGLSSVDIQNVMRQIFGVRGQRAGATLLRNLEEYERFSKMLKDPKQTQGTAADKMEIMMDSVQGAIWRVSSAMDGLKASFTSAVGPPLIKMLRGLEKAIAWVSKVISTPVGKFFSQMAAGALLVVTPLMLLRAAVASLAFAMKSFTVTTGGMAASLKFMSAQMFGLSTGMAAAGIGNRKYGKFTPGTVAVMNAAGTKTTTAATPATYMMAKGEKSSTSSRGRTIITGGMRKGPKRLPAGTQVMTHPGRGIGLIGKGLTKGLGVLFGPWGFALMALASFAPLIISAFSRNTKAVDDNTNELKKQAPMSKNMAELYNILRGEKLENIVKGMSDHLETLIREDRYSREAIVQAIANNDFPQLVGILQGLGNVKSKWKVGPS